MATPLRGVGGPIVTTVLVTALGLAPCFRAHANAFDPQKPKPVMVFRGGYVAHGSADFTLELDSSELGTVTQDEHSLPTLGLSVGFPYTDELRFGVSSWLSPSTEFSAGSDTSDPWKTVDINAMAEYLVAVDGALSLYGSAESGISLMVPPDPSVGEPEIDTFWGYNIAGALGVQGGDDIALRGELRLIYYDVAATFDSQDGELTYRLAGTRFMVAGGFAFF